MNSLHPAVFLDRDGVLVAARVEDGVPRPAASPNKLDLLPGVAEACRLLREAGHLLICVTNQPDVARGTQDQAMVDAVNSQLRDRLGLDDVLVCTHDDDDHCDCRKPSPGLLLEAAQKWSIDLQASVMVGDRWRDIEAGRRAGCSTVFIDRGYAERAPDRPDVIAEGLLQAVPIILQGRGLIRRLTPSSVIPAVASLRVKIFADGADLASIVALAADPLIKGFTTNPTLMRSAGVKDYEAFARQILEAVPRHPVSFEVFADDFGDMERQARRIASWGDNVFVKIPVTDTSGTPSDAVVERLAGAGVKLNVTALMTPAQVARVTALVADGPQCFISVFAGRIADTGRDPVPLMQAALDIMVHHQHLSLIWASPREVLNVFQADAIGCHVITVTHDLLRKFTSVGKDLTEFSLDTVRMFYRDAEAAGYAL